jgi:hypothetical protein
VDLNQLYSDHQRLLIKAGRARTPALRHGHEVAASHVAGRIGCMQRALGASGANAWDALAILGKGSLAAPARHLAGYAA